MATATGPGPEREHCALSKDEADTFALLVEISTYNVERLQISHTISLIVHSQGISVIDGFQRSVRKIWRIPPKV